jgi:hypothetical protein
MVVLLAGGTSCGLLNRQPNGRISVKVVSWPLVKKFAEPDAGLPGHKVTLINTEGHSVVAQKTTDAYGEVVFDVPAGTYSVLGVGDQPEDVKVYPDRVVSLKLIVH